LRKCSLSKSEICFILETLRIDHANNSFATNHRAAARCNIADGLRDPSPHDSGISDRPGRSNQCLERDGRTILEGTRGRTDRSRDCEGKARGRLRHLAKLLALVVQRFASKEEDAI